MKISIGEQLRLFGFIQKNINNPEVLARDYHANKEKYDTLARQYPEYRQYLNTAPSESVEKLRKLGVPV